MRFFNLGRRNTKQTTVRGGRIAVSEKGVWSVTASAAYRKLTIAASQIEYEVERNPGSEDMISNIVATTVAAKIAYGCSVVNVDNNRWQVLDNDRLELVFDELDRLIGFEYRSMNDELVPVERFLYSMNQAPGRTLVGALSDAAEDIQAENMTQAVAASLAENLSYIGLVAYVEGESDPAKLQAIADTISASFTGDNRGGVLAVSDNVKIESLLNVTSLNPIGTDNLRASRQAIAAAFGVPYDLLYTDSSNRASIDTAKDLLFRDTLIPAAKAVVADFGNTNRFGRISLTEESLMLGHTSDQAEVMEEVNRNTSPNYKSKPSVQVQPAKIPEPKTDTLENVNATSQL